MHFYAFCLSAILLFITGTSSVFRYPELAPEVNAEQFPFTAVITRRKNETVGTGTILTTYFVMTVCDKQRRSWDPKWRLEKGERGYSNWRVIAGSSFNHPTGQEQGFQVRFVSFIENHPKCKVGGKYGNVYDAAVIKVTKRFVFNNLVRPIPIERDRNTFHDIVETMIMNGENCTVAGWGIYKYRDGDKYEINLNGYAIAGEKSPKLRKMEYQLEDTIFCSNMNQDNFAWVFMKPSTDKICALGKNVVGKLCDADEGAPLVCRGLVIGFFSQSAGCGTKWWGHPTIFTRLDMGLDPWLKLYLNAGDKADVNGENFVP